MLQLCAVPDLEGHDNLDSVLTFHSPTKKKKKRKNKKRGGGYGGARKSSHFNSEYTDSDDSDDGSPSGKNPVAALLATRMATSPKSKSQMLKDNAAKNKVRGAWGGVCPFARPAILSIFSGLLSLYSSFKTPRPCLTTLPIL